MQLHKCMQAGNPTLSINLYIMFINDEYNSYVAFDGKTKSYKSLL